MKGKNMIQVIVFKEKCGDRTSLVAQGLEYDIAAQSDNLPDLKREFERMVYGQVVACVESGLKPFENVPKAPQRYWDMLGKAYAIKEEAFEPSLELPVTVANFDVPRSEMRVYF